jgi:hypothetical protein
MPSPAERPETGEREHVDGLLRDFAAGKRVGSVEMGVLEQHGYVHAIPALTAKGTDRAEALGVQFDD